jgi:hypothetical protein
MAKQLMTIDQDGITQADFARLTNVSRARVSQWIRESKIGGDALATEGGRVRIRPEPAKAQLRRALNIDQRHGNGLFTRLDAAPPSPQALPAATPPPSDAEVGPFVRPESVPDAIEERIKRERLEGLQRDNRKKAEDEAARRGLYTLTADVKQQFGRIAAQEKIIFEGSLGQIATAFSARFPHVNQRDALHLLRSEFRKICSQASAELRAKAIDLPEFVAGELPSSAASCG